MHSGTRWWRRHGFGPTPWVWAACGPSDSTHRSWTYESRGFEGFGSGRHGVRRPLRFLAWKLDLDEDQMADLARILGELKTERAQADVDRARTIAAFADAISGEEFDAEKAGEGAALRVASAERLRRAVTQALERLHAILDDEQRRTLAYLIRTGVVAF